VHLSCVCPPQFLFRSVSNLEQDASQERCAAYVRRTSSCFVYFDATCGMSLAADKPAGNADSIGVSEVHLSRCDGRTRSRDTTQDIYFCALDGCARDAEVYIYRCASVIRDVCVFEGHSLRAHNRRRPLQSTILYYTTHIYIAPSRHANQKR